MKNNNGFTPIEVIFVLILISLFISFLTYRYKQLEFNAKKIVAYIDMRNLNLAVKIYKFKFGKYPDNLLKLKEKGLLVFNSTPIISHYSFFKKGKLLDPFGNPYNYDNKKGIIYFDNKTNTLLNKS